MPVLSFVSAMIKPGEDIRVAVNWAIENEFHGVEISARAFSPDPLDDDGINWLVDRSAEHQLTYTQIGGMPASWPSSCKRACSPRSVRQPRRKRPTETCAGLARPASRTERPAGIG